MYSSYKIISKVNKILITCHVFDYIFQILVFQSHARTVVRDCCKGDDESQWERGKFDPRHPKST